MRKIVLYFMFINCINVQLIAQGKPYKTGTAYFDSLKSQPHSIKPTGDFDQRFSFIGNKNKNVSIWGYRIGALINDRIKVGIGGYTLTANFDTNITKLRAITNISQVNQTLTYGTMYIEPFLVRSRRWEMSMVFEIGYGTAKIDSTNIRKTTGNRPSTTTRLSTKREPFVPIGMGLSANLIIPDMKGLHFLTYLGLNGMVGMRQVIIDSDFKENFDGFYWSIGTAIYVDRIFSDLKRKKKSTP